MSHRSKRPSAVSRERSKRLHRKKLTWLWVTLGAVLLAGVGILLLHAQAAPLAALTPAQTYKKYQAGAFFLDVRTQAEWDQYHLVNSTLIPLDELADRLGELPRDQEIVVVCRSGHRAQSGAVLLQKAGFTRLAYLSGGLQAWAEAGYPGVGTAP